MTKKTTDPISDEEWARMEHLFDTHVRSFGDKLIPVVAVAYRRQIAETVATDWMAKARIVLGKLALALPLSTGERSHTEDRLTRNLTEVLLDRLEHHGDDPLAEEAESGAYEIAELVLSSWFHCLGQRDAGIAGGVALDSLLLPPGEVATHRLDQLELAMYGVPLDEVQKALRCHWDDSFALTAEAVPPVVQLGRALWIVPELSTFGRSYRLFDNENAASRFASQPSTLVQAAAVETQFDLAHRLAAQTLSESVQEPAEDLHHALVEFCSVVADGGSDTTATDTVPVPDLLKLAQSTPQWHFAHSLATGLKCLRNCSGLSHQQAIVQLKNSDVAANLVRCSIGVGLDTKPLNYAYTMMLATAATARSAGSISVLSGEPNRAGAIAVICRVFAHALGLSAGQARTLATATLPAMGWLYTHAQSDAEPGLEHPSSPHIVELDPSAAAHPRPFVGRYPTPLPN